MLSFRVEGPFEIEPIHEQGGKLIERSSVETFWNDADKAHLADAVGCYVFGFRAGTGILPVYVGQSKTGFKHECFDHHKLTHYNTALVKKLKGTPIMFFVVKDEGSMCAFEACIDRVEHLLIQFALARNPDLANVHIADWSIHGVYRSSPGGVSKSAHLFRKCLGFADSVVDAVHDAEPGAPGPLDVAVPGSTAPVDAAHAVAAVASAPGSEFGPGCDELGF
jgi:hypothetical protein